MSDKALSDEAVKVLLRLPGQGVTWETAPDKPARELEARGLASVAGTGMDFPECQRTHIGDCFAATLDHHTNQAKEDERRRIDELATELAKHWTHEFLFAAKEDRWEIASGGSDLDILGVGESFTACLEAATQKQGE